MNSVEMTFAIAGDPFESGDVDRRIVPNSSATDSPDDACRIPSFVSRRHGSHPVPKINRIRRGAGGLGVLPSPPVSSSVITSCQRCRVSR
ncbi:hypothetical protein, partial [Micromonospora sp. CPCC 205558]|uniref:hypothetical protein n=1 Tax=Micromonospora sp. CPCC 205558 TaxID=3122403 RepID=UPI002FF299C1